jgi:hypothetical protein
MTHRHLAPSSCFAWLHCPLCVTSVCRRNTAASMFIFHLFFHLQISLSHAHSSFLRQNLAPSTPCLCHIAFIMCRIVTLPRFAAGTLVRFFISFPLSFADRFSLSHLSPPARAFVTHRPLAMHPLSLCIAFCLMTSSLTQCVAARVPPRCVALFVQVYPCLVS